MNVKAVEMTRKIRDRIYQETKGMSPEKLAAHIRKQAGQFQGKTTTKKNH